MHPATLLLQTLRFGDRLEPASLRAAWATAATPGLARLVSFEGCALWLYRRLRQIDEAWASPLATSTFGTWLERRARADAAQNMRVDAQTESLLRLLNARGIPHVLLKGAARRAAAHLFPYADARTTNDVDVLLPATEARHMWEQLRTLGYDYATRPEHTPSGHYHLPPLCDRGRVAVELHTSTSRAVSSEEAWRRASSGTRELRQHGITMPVPSSTELLWHGVTHAVHHQTGAFRLRFFQDVSVILASGAEIDWGELRARLDSTEIADRSVTGAWLGAAAWLAGTRLSTDITGSVAPFDLPRALRWRLAVLRRLSSTTRSGEKLLEEGTRAEIGWGLTPAPAGTPVLLRGRRRAAAAAARFTYSLWRAALRVPQAAPSS